MLLRSLHTALSRDECRDRLVAATGTDTISGRFGSVHPVLSLISGNAFRLRKRRGYRNSLAPAFYGKLRDDASGTVIEGCFKMRRAVVVAMGVWFGGCAIMALASVSKSGWTALRIPFAFILFGYLLLRFSRWLARNEEAYLWDFVQETLEATPRSEPAAERKVTSCSTA